MFHSRWHLKLCKSTLHGYKKSARDQAHDIWRLELHGLQSLPPSPKRAERKVRRRPFREAGSGHKQWNTVSCVDTFSIIRKFSAQNSKI